jgi:hypothetical protein
MACPKSDVEGDPGPVEPVALPPVEERGAFGRRSWSIDGEGGGRFGIDAGVVLETSALTRNQL